MVSIKFAFVQGILTFFHLIFLLKLYTAFYKEGFT